jgi:hypothetical protein
MKMQQYKKPVKINKKFKQPISDSFRSFLLHKRTVTLKQILTGKKVGYYSGGNNVQYEYIPIYFYEYDDNVYLADILPLFVNTVKRFKLNKPRFFKELKGK